MIINCTPHPIVIGSTTFEPSGILPRVSTIETVSVPIEEFVGGHKVFETVTQRTGDVTGLPAPVQGTFLIVSGMVFAASDRQDLIAPDTGKSAVRDDKGHIVAVTRFLRK